MSRRTEHTDSDWCQWKHRWGASVFAGVVSVLIHAAALTVLCFIGFSQSRTDEQARAIPSADISAVSRLLNQVVVTSRPKIKRPGPADDIADGPAPLEKVFPSKIIDNLPAATQPGEKQAAFQWPRAVKLGEQVQFFGLDAGERRVCYVVDSTASIDGRFARVQAELKASIRKLQPDQFFSIVFYGAGGLRRFSGGRLIRANAEAVNSAVEFVSLINPGGSGDALAALRRAREICGDTPEATQVIYFLTDGLELDGRGAADFTDGVEQLLLELGPGTRINTIALRPRGVDRKVLEQIAESTGGQFLSPPEPKGPQPGVIDLTDIDFLEGTAVEDE